MKQGKVVFLKTASLILLSFIIAVLAAFVVNFDASFTVFHLLFFRNNDWLFDPVANPVINILPETFFLHAALFILALIVLAIIILSVCHKKLLRKMGK
ncbi:TIGR01906 family membrane protein [Sporolactobacillus sp. KGMB 08714]|uniref:TIGR01906 family membrane protein n=1 Tax=Sporolactobacillus sp. KGMB 08714 TaxID=3064704 RepID=UPI002FBEA674